MQAVFSLKFMPLLNGSSATKRLRNIIDVFFGKFKKINRGIIFLNTSIVPQVLWQNPRRYFSDHSKTFFPVQNGFPIEGWEKLDFITFKE